MRRFMLFISSYIPLYLLLILKNILERCSVEGRINISIEKIKNVKLFDEINDYALVILFLLCIISFLYLKKLVQKKSGNHFYKIIQVEDQTGSVYFNYISVYLLSCLGLTLNSVVDVFVLLFLMGLVGYIYISNHMTYMNPVLQFMGYKVYEGVLYSQSTKKEIKTIFIISNTLLVSKNCEFIGSGKEDFVYITKTNEE